MNVVILSEDFEFSEFGLEKIHALLPKLKIRYPGEIDDDLISVAIVDDSPNRNLKRYQNLEIILSVSAGVDSLLSELGSLEVPIARAIPNEMVALMKQYVAYQVIRLHRQMYFHEHNQIERRWVWHPPSVQSSKYHVLVMGLGKLGLPVAGMLQGMGYCVSGWSASRKENYPFRTLAGLTELNEVLGSVDLAISILPLTSTTSRIMNEDFFSVLKAGAAIINVGRGECVDDSALCDAMISGKVSFTVLDVFRQEPLPRSHQFWECKNVAITPHIGSYPHPDSFVDPIVNCLLAFLENSAIPNIVSINNGY